MSQRLTDVLQRLSATIEARKGGDPAVSYTAKLLNDPALAAKKLAKQGEEVVSSDPKSAFPAATLALALWDRYPDFGPLLLGYMFECCPFLVPLQPPPKQLRSKFRRLSRFFTLLKIVTTRFFRHNSRLFLFIIEFFNLHFNIIQGFLFHVNFFLEVFETL